MSAIVRHAPATDRWFRAALAAWAAAVVASWLVINVGDRGDSAWFNVLVGGVGGALCLAAGARAARAYGQRTFVGRAAVLLGLAYACWGIGSLIWYGYNRQGEEAPYPSVADAFFLLLPVFVALGLSQLRRLLAVRWRELASSAWIPLAIVALTAYMTMPTVTIAGVDIGRSWLFSDGYTGAQQALSTAYMVGDIVTLSLALLLLQRARHTAGGELFQPLVVASLALVAMYAADMVFDQRLSSGTYFNGDVADGLYALSFGCMLAALDRFVAAHRRLRRRAAGGAA